MANRDFYNLVLDLTVRGVFDPSDAGAVRSVLEAALEYIRGPEGLGGVLYISRVPGGQLWVDLSTPLEIPENVELYLGAGVVLVPVAARGAALNPLRIKGSFRAPMGRVFPTAEWFDARARSRSPAYNLTSVRFTGRAIDRVHPEWWGAGDRTASPNDSAALEAAVRAATAERWTRESLGGEVQWLRALPIELRDTYVLARPLVIERGDRPDDAIELRGSPGGSGNPTFVCHADFPRTAGVAMLTTRNIEAMTLDDVRFDANDRAGVCLAMESVRDTGALDEGAARRGHYLRHCGFTGAREQLVRLDVQERSEVSLGGQMAPQMDTTYEGLRLEGCRFNPVQRSDSLPSALVVSAPPAAAIEVRGCIFEGEALAMIHAKSCALSVTNCQFRNSALPPAPVAGDVENLHQRGPDGGVDIFLDVRGGLITSPASLLVPATLYSQDCRSTSVQFLATCRSARPHTGRDCSIIGLHHADLSAPETLLTWQGRRAPPIPDDIPPDPVAPSAFKMDPAVAIPPKTSPNDRVLGKSLGPDLAPTLELSALLPLPQAEPRWIPGLLGARPTPIHWRIPASAGAWLTLTGCRFDGPSGITRAAVRGFSGCGPIGDLGVFSGTGRGDGALIVMDSGLPMSVPRLGDTPGP